MLIKSRKWSFDVLHKDDLSLISRARKISNHPFLLFWDESEQKLTSDTLKSEDDEFIETRQQLIKLVFMRIKWKVMWDMF